MGPKPHQDGAAGPAPPKSALAAVGSSPRTAPPGSFPATRPHFHLPSRMRPTAEVTRSNAIRRPSSGPPNRKDSEVNGSLALGLTPTSPPPPIPLTQMPPMKTSTLPLAPLPPVLPVLPFPLPPRRARVPHHRNAMIILAPQDLPQELRDIQLDVSITQDDST
ncbi:hypothetical protein PGT21_020339 [Puccinia graminis f. sp. tritici]|uniref:Uncharacterized protein n=2 Tax=Puccinia graminis f. sp. tritici TaxID=56615 RepID=E3KRD6_PUCGT|nr:uncharacterized protein PGTG_13243 [Puccinia graminis f. sp. tritici CRL 75-36-700-3]EFP86861.1 hypothetical protein PGTG_13243 [Puccinia graminis f. sp. tritici CRL 75-36-700-3]KAA1077799.1 hypothetical protein PGT21_020339 [Puccinia graminis f. sp. tritici]KAA1102628.1 hypothetical protein PGTUg99_025245 [Puccinia graminis f. sp. tritici]